MKRLSPIISAALLFALASRAQAQRGPRGPRNPHIGYVYPAGAQRGTVCRIAVGGQYLDGMDNARLSGGGVQFKVLDHEKPMGARQMTEMRDKLKEAREKILADGMDGQHRSFMGRMRLAQKVSEEAGVSVEQIRKLKQIGEARRDPKNQDNPQIGETLVLEINVAPDAEPGHRELRLTGRGRLSNPLAFVIGDLPEHVEQEPNDKSADAGAADRLPVVLNGQIMPGDVDRFAFHAPEGSRVVVAAAARELIPHLADAVPGWFQATIALYDADRNEVAYADDYRFNPDPALCYEIPEDGTYVVEIRDAIYRGREDFVYRITVGDVPFVTSIFPLGGRSGAQTVIELRGVNLPVDTLNADAREQGTGTAMLSEIQNTYTASRVPFVVDDLPERVEREPNDARSQAQTVFLPTVVNGRINTPGDRDVFAFKGATGQRIVAEVKARRLSSPLDSVLKITDAAGNQLAINDDFEDKGAGLVTHHADSLLRVSLPQNGTYFVHVGDTQGKGGRAYAYRLYLNPERPDFALRVVPSGINAQPGAHVPITVYALREDGFTGEIALALKDAPAGFALSGARIPAGQDKIRLTLTTPLRPADEPIRLALQGRATIAKRQVVRTAVPAEDMMQAFIYRHLVPAEDLLVSNTQQRRPRPGMQLSARGPVKLRPGSAARLEVPVPPRMLFLKDRLEFELSEPPDGVTIEDVSRGRQGITINLQTTRSETEQPREGNLIVNAYMRMSARGGKGGKSAKGQEFRAPIGALPAIPYKLSM